MKKYKSFAKINIGLDVLGRRPDGYHNIKTIMQRVSLSDILSIEKSDMTKISSSVNFIPTDEKNLVYKAILAFREYTGIDANLYVHIQKRIPTQAGLGGGSSNAATTLLALDEIYGTNLTTKELSEMAVKLGADVPFFLMPSPAMCEGIGEIITPIEDIFPAYYVLIVKPRFSVSTKEAYDRMDNIGITMRPDFDKILPALKNGNGDMLKKSAINVFEDYARTQFPQIEEIKKQLLDIGALVSFMSGSGSSIVGIFDKRPSVMDLDEGYRQNSFVEQFINK